MNGIQRYIQEWPCMYTYMHKYIHKYVHTYIDSFIRSFIHLFTRRKEGPSRCGGSNKLAAPKAARCT